MVAQNADENTLADKSITWLNRPPGVALTAALALTSALTGFLGYNQYPVLTPEIGLVVLFIALLSAGFGLAYHYTRWFGRGIAIVVSASMPLFLVAYIFDKSLRISWEDVLVFLLAAVLLATAVIFAFRFFTRTLGQGLLVIILGTVFVELTTTSLWSALAVLAVFLATRRHFLPIMAIFAVTFLVTNPLVGRFGSAAPEGVSGLTAKASVAGHAQFPRSDDKPFILHLILDEHLGIDGFNSLEIDPRPIQRDLLDFYDRHRFQIFTGAYSRHIHTKNAVPALRHLGAEPDDPEADLTGRDVDRYAYFEEFASRRYALTVLHPSGFPYCRASEFMNCQGYRANGPKPFRTSDMSALEKAKFILSEFLSLSHTVEALTGFYDYAAFVLRSRDIPVPRLTISDRASNPTIMGAQLLGQIATELELAQPGTAYFAHVMFPHYPYMYDAVCNLKAFADWGYPSRGYMHGPIAGRQADYLEQIRCGLRHLEALMAALDRSAAKDNYVVILQGDHGSRIVETFPSAETIGTFSDRDLIAGFSTLFAVRYPKPNGGHIKDHLPIDKLLENLVENDFQAIRPDDIARGTRTVILDNRDWAPTVAYELPKHWPGPAGSGN